MSLVALLAVAIGLAAVVGLLLLVRGRAGRPSDPVDGEGEPDGLATRTYRRARSRALLCIGAAFAVLVGGMVLNSARPELLGLPLALAPGVAAATALLGFAVLPSAVEPSNGPVSAALTPRTAWSFGPRRAFAVPATLVAASLAFLGWAALVADPDDQGRMRSITLTDGMTTASAGPFPGSFYGLPLAAVTILLAGSTYLALRRIASTAALPVPLASVADRHWRTVSTRVVSQLATTALLGHLGGTAAFAGLAVRSAGSTIGLNGGNASGTALAGAALAVVGAALLAAGVLTAVLGVGNALTLRSASSSSDAASPLASAPRS